MAAAPLTTVLQQLRVLAASGPTRDAGDGQLLGRFLQSGDERAFEALVRRHGPMVHGVCRRILGPGPDLDDAVQATFLVLARKAASLRKQAALASWLHGIARRLALRLKGQRLRRQQRESRLAGHEELVEAGPRAVDPAVVAGLRELGRVIDEEIERLPVRQREVLVLCQLEGLSSTEAAGRLSCPASTVKSRLLKARAVLQQRLRRRGITLSLTALAVITAEQAAGAGLPLPLVRAAVQGATGAAAAVSPRALLAAEQLVATIPLAHWPLALLGVLAVALVTVAALRPVPAPGGPGQAAPPPAAATQLPPALDPHGDLLPAGAQARHGTVRWRHGGYTGFIAFLPDGKGVVSAGDDQVFHVWEFPSGKELRRFGPGAAAPLPPPGRLSRSRLPVALSPDGKVLACQFDGGPLLLYDVAAAKLLATLESNQDQPFLNNLTFSPNGKHLAVRDLVGGIRVWDWAQAKVVETFEVRHGVIVGEVPPLVYSPDGTLLAMTATGFDDQSRLFAEVKVVDLANGKAVRTLPLEPKSFVQSVVFSPDGKLLAAAGDNGVIHLADAATGKVLHRLAGTESDQWSLAFAGDGRALLARSSRHQDVREWDVTSGKELRQLGPVAKKGPLFDSGRWSRATPSPDGKTLAFTGLDHCLHFLDLPSGKESHGAAGNTLPLLGVGFSPDGQRLWAQGQGKGLRQWDRASGKELDPLALPVGVSQAVLSADGRFVAAPPSWDKAGSVVDAATGKQVCGIPPTPVDPNESGPAPASMALAADGSLLAVRWERLRKIELLAVPSGKLLHTLAVAATPTDMAVDGLACWPVMFFSADGKLLAAYSAPGELSLWETATGQRRALLTVPGATPFTGGAFAPDGRCLALETKDGQVLLWELAAGKPRAVLAGKPTAADGPKATVPRGISFDPHMPSAHNVAFSPNGRLLAHGGPDCVVRVWDVHTGREAAVFRGHRGSVNALAFSADGKTLASASCDTTVLTWDVAALAAAPAPRGLTAKELQTHWESLRSGDARAAFAAVAELAASPVEAVAFLEKKLQPAPALDPERVRLLLDRLDDAGFKVREQAIAELQQMGGGVLPALDKALAGKPPLEVRKRLEKLRDSLTALVLSAEDLRTSRAIEVLERVSSPAARKLLERLANGAPGALTTTTARRALERG
jgi:RNA polymerase sigma factor (sigma-70 family)